MTRRLSSLLALAALFVSFTMAKDKNKRVFPEYVMHARTAVVMIDPDAGEPLDHPHANANARESVEKALLEWGRFDLLNDGQESDLIFVVRTGSGKAMQPTIKGGPIDQRPGYGESTDSTIRIGGHQGQPPSQQDPSIYSPDRGPHISNQAGPADDMFEVYQGGIQSPLDSTPVWRYVAKDCLREPKVAAVEEFRKLIAEQEKVQPPKKP
jgi:hypothetical protein